MYEEINAFLSRPSAVTQGQKLQATKTQFVEELNRIYKLPSIQPPLKEPKGDSPAAAKKSEVVSAGGEPSNFSSYDNKSK